MRTPTRCILLLLLTSPAWGQGVSDRPTGLDRLPPGYVLSSGQSGTPHGQGLDPQKLQEYLAAVEAVDLAAEFQAQGAARSSLAVDRISIEATWDRSSRGRAISGGQPHDAPVLSSLRIRPLATWAAPIRSLPNGPGRHVVSLPGVGQIVVSAVTHRSDGLIELEVPGSNYTVDPRGRYRRGRGGWKGQAQRIGNKINEVTINRQGHLHIDVAGMPDINVKKVTRDRNGDLRLHVSSILIPDIVIDKRTGKASIDFGIFGEKELGNLKMLTEIDRWPPSLQDLASMKFDSSSGEAETAFTGALSFQLAARGRDGRTVDFAGVRGEVGDVRLSGVAQIDENGFRILGDRSAYSLELSVGGPLAVNGQLHAGNASGRLQVQGRYGLRLPKNGGSMDLEVDGRVTFDLQGNTIRIRVPNGPQVDAAQARANGGAAFAFTQRAGESRLTVRDGVYRLALDGPVKIKKLDAGRLTIDDVTIDGNVTSQGRIGLDAEGLKVDADLHAQGDVTGQAGMARVVQGDVTVEARPTAGSLSVDFDELELTSPLGRGATALRTRGQATGRGLVIEDVRVDAPAGSGSAERVQVDFDLGVRTVDGAIESGTGTATAELLGEGQLSGSTATAATQGERVAVVNVSAGGKLNYRDAPSTDTGRILGQLTRGDRVKVLGDRGAWRHVQLASGGEAFVHGRYLSEERTPGRAASSAEWSVGLGAGTRAEVTIDESSTGDAASVVRGRISTQLVLSSAELRSAAFETKILGAARASLNDVEFAWQGGAQNPLRVAERVEVPFEVALEPGSRLKSEVNEIVIDRTGSTIVGKAIVKIDAQGPRIESIEGVDARIVSSGITRFGGRIVELNGVKTLIVKGRMVIKPNGLDIYGEVGLTVRGDERTPVISINW
ncbi:MAG: SH3 domain-containing protein [Planctomycetota bacterium]